MSKSVWILNHYAMPPYMPGGTRHYDLSQELIKKGYKVTIFSSGFSHEKKNYFKLFKEEQYIVEDYEKLKFVWLKTTSYKKNNYKRTINMISYLTKILKVVCDFPKPDIIIGSSVHPLAVVAAWWLSKKYKAKFIFEVRDLWPQTPIDMKIINANSITAKLLYRWEKFMYQKANKIIILFPNARNYIESKGISIEKVVWIPNGVNLERFENPKQLDPDSNLVQLLRENKNNFKVIYTGAHGPANGLSVIIDTATILQRNRTKIHFFLIGDGAEKDKLQYDAEKHNLKNINFFSPIPKEQIPDLLRYADLLLHCFAPIDVFKYGISPNKIYDYLASGKPIIMSVKTSNNIVQDARAGITVEPGNSESLAKGILKIEKMTAEEREKLGANGRAYVEKYHNTRVLADVLEKIL
jgi:glycosyltransferase involved in cell wall biosynthesis